MKHRKRIRKFRKKVRGSLTAFFTERLSKFLPRGVDLFADIRNEFPNIQILTIFDIGANLGESAAKFKSEFPKATIWAFEPSRSTFEKLQARFSGASHVRCFNFGFGREEGSVKLSSNEIHQMRRVIGLPEQSLENENMEDVYLTTIDTFCFEKNIDDIDYLKIDAEGHELEILFGACDMLKPKSVKFLELELGMNPENTYHCRFEDAKTLLEQKGFRIFSITEQAHEWLTKKPHLRRVNALFVSCELIGIELNG